MVPEVRILFRRTSTKTTIFNYALNLNCCTRKLFFSEYTIIAPQKAAAQSLRNTKTLVPIGFRHILTRSTLLVDCRDEVKRVRYVYDIYDIYTYMIFELGKKKFIYIYIYVIFDIIATRRVYMVYMDDTRVTAECFREAVNARRFYYYLRAILYDFQSIAATSQPFLSTDGHA